MKETETTAATPVVLKQRTLERWENEGGEIPTVPAPQPAGMSAVRRAGKKLFVFDLDGTLAESKAALDALEATRRALSETACELFAAVRATIGGEASGREELRRVQIQQALDQTQEFFAKIPPVNEDEPPSPSRVAQLHAIDHLTRLQAHLYPEGNVVRVLPEERVRPMAAQGRAILELRETGLSGRAPEDWLAQLERAAAALAEQRRQERPAVLQQTADGPAKALEILDAMRWLDRVGYHTWRIGNYLGGDGKTESVPAD